MMMYKKKGENITSPKTAPSKSTRRLKKRSVALRCCGITSAENPFAACLSKNSTVRLKSDSAIYWAMKGFDER